jgi:hypothetical protein
MQKVMYLKWVPMTDSQRAHFTMTVLRGHAIAWVQSSTVKQETMTFILLIEILDMALRNIDNESEAIEKIKKT